MTAGSDGAGPTDAAPNETGPNETGPTDAGPSETVPTEAGPSQAGSNGRSPHWQRLHPLTPYLRSWAVLAAIIFGAVSNGTSIPRAVSEAFEGDAAARTVLLWGALVVAVCLVLYTLWAVLSWRMTRYRLDDDALEYEMGVVFRQHRQARLDRLQAVDVVRPVLARLLGLSELRLEVAGGSGSDVRLQYLRADDTQRLREAVLARATAANAPGAGSATTNPDMTGANAAGPNTTVLAAPSSGALVSAVNTVAQPERHLVTVPARRLVGSWLLGWGTAVAVLVLAAVAPATILLPGVMIASVPAIVGMVLGAVKRVAGVFGFTAAEGSDGLRLRYGLLETRTQTVPIDRVQAVALSQPLLWRWCDWWTVEVNIAGYGTAASSGQILLPVGTRSEAIMMLARVLPQPGIDDPLALVTAGLTGQTGSEGAAIAAPDGFVGAPRRSRPLDPIGWRRNGFSVTPAALFLRSGVLTRRLVVVPHARMQSIGVRVGPIQRALRLASVLFHSTPGPVRPAMRHLDPAVAAHLVDEQARRARLARTVEPGSGSATTTLDR